MSGHELGEAGAPDPSPAAAAEAPEVVHGGRLEHPGRLAENPSGRPMQIKLSHRLAAIGMTGSGKSKLCAHLWAINAGQRILIDVTDACALGPAALDDPGGACVAERLKEIDWRCRTIHYVPRAQSDAAYNDLYAAIFARGNLCVWLDESQGPTSANRAPRWLRTTLTQGRKKRIQHLAATQEPMNVLPVIYSQAEHAALFRLTGRMDELRAIAPRLGMTTDELLEELGKLAPHGYLLHQLDPAAAGAPPRRMPPLPPAVIEHVEQHVRFIA